LIIGFVLFTVTSVFDCVIVNGYYMLACRLIAAGAAWGLEVVPENMQGTN
jgi:hypothetical protein